MSRNELGTEEGAQMGRLLLDRERHFSDVSGQVVFLALPSLCEQRVASLLSLFESLGAEFTAAETSGLRKAVALKIEEGFSLYTSAQVIVRFSRSPKGGINYSVACERITLADRYEEWVDRGELPFGSHPDAMVSAVANELGSQRKLRVLDIGAGTGRNSLALARQGHVVDAIEVTSSFAARIQQWAERQKLPVKVFCQDFLEEEFEERDSSYDLIVATEVTSHFRDARDLRLLFERCHAWSVPGARIVLNAFLAEPSYQPDDFARECGQAHWATFYTEQDVTDALAGLGLRQLTDEPVVEYEREHLPREAWPPTRWFINWAQGRDVFPIDSPPVQMRWRVYERT